MDINDCDRKQLKAIKYYLDKFESKSIDLSYLIYKLFPLFNSLTSTEENWNTAFFQKMVDLESIYAGFLESEKPFDSEEKKIVNNAVQFLKILTDQILNNFTKFLNNTITRKADILDDKWLFCPTCLDAWESTTKDPLVICPKCDNAFLNPRSSH